MNSIQQVYFCGLGALGGMYASRLCAVPGVDLKIVADLERIQRYQEHGIVVNGNRLRLSFLSPTDTAPIADLVIIGVKWHQLDQALAQIRPFVGPSTVILSLLNGIESENVIARTLGVQPLYSFVVETDAGRKGQQIEYRTLGTGRSALSSPHQVGQGHLHRHLAVAQERAISARHANRRPALGQLKGSPEPTLAVCKLALWSWSRLARVTAACADRLTNRPREFRFLPNQFRGYAC